MKSTFTMFKGRKFIPAGTLMVGIDMGKFNCCATAITERGRFVSNNFWFKLNKKSLEKFYLQILKWMQEVKYNRAVAGMESTGPFCFAVVEFLNQKGIEVKFVNPLHVRRNRESFDNCPSKTDPKDSFIIAKLLDEGKFLRRLVLDDAYMNVETLCKLRDNYVHEMTFWKNLLHSSLSQYFPEFAGLFSTLAGKTQLAILEKAPLPQDVCSFSPDELTNLICKSSNGRHKGKKAQIILEAASDSIGSTAAVDSARYRIKEEVKEIKALDKKIAQIEDELENVLKPMDAYVILNSIPGLSLVSIAWIIGTVGDMSKFDKTSQVVKYLGYNLGEISSGIHKGRRRMTKRGPSKIRGILYLAALRMSKKGGIFEEKYKALRSRGKPVPVVINALACKLVKIAFALLRDRVFYRRVC